MSYQAKIEQQQLRRYKKYAHEILSYNHIARNHGRNPSFAGIRVPVQTLLDYLKAGESINDFLDGFPTVTILNTVTSCEF